jgi:glycosyltransferase involved in cell wall biosynthesis
MTSDICIVIEWENVLLAEQTRSSEMLVRLKKQISEISDRKIEILIIFDSEKLSEAQVRELIDPVFCDPHSLISLIAVQIIASPGVDYYQAKNFGASFSDAEVIVFLDSDVIPEDGWLSAITEPFWNNDDIQVLGGHTYVDPKGVVGKAFSLGWFFPIPTRELCLANKKIGFFANNVAFRRNVLHKYKFPKMPKGMTRGSCSMLAMSLLTEGILIWGNSAARTSHPHPNGFKHFIIRGLAQGRDRAMSKDIDQLKSIYAGLRFFASSCYKTAKNNLKHYSRVQLPVWQVPISLGIMFFYYFLVFTGTLLYVSFPTRTSQAWRI